MSRRRTPDPADLLNAAIRRSIARDEGEKQTGPAMYRRIRNLIVMTNHWDKHAGATRRRTHDEPQGQ